MKKWISMLLIAALCLGLALGASAEAVTETDAVSSATRQTEAQTARKGNGGRGRTAKPAQTPDAPGAEQPDEANPEGEAPAAPTEGETSLALPEGETPARAGDRQKQQNAAVRVEILEVGDGWVKLSVNGKAGYVKLQLLLEALTENPPDAEVKN